VQAALALPWAGRQGAIDRQAGGHGLMGWLPLDFEVVQAERTLRRLA